MLSFLHLKCKGINHFDDLERMEILSPHWNPPPLPKTAWRCSVCRKPDCKRPRCIQLNLFGLGVLDPKCLIPGEHLVFKTNKEMSSILNGHECHAKCPLELSAESDNNSLVSATFPFVKSDTDNNLKKKTRKEKEQSHQKRMFQGTFITLTN